MKGMFIVFNFPMWESNTPKPSPSSSSGSRISPALLLIIVVLSVIFFIAGVLHFLVRFLTKRRRSFSFSQSTRTTQEIPHSGGSFVVQRQLQQLFHLHDSGLDQAFIDALPVFTYKDIMGLKEPFDCAVCLCEFLDQDDLRLLPLCSHAFHVDCIDTWLLSNSTCPLCRGVLFAPDFCIENPIFHFDELREDGDVVSRDLGVPVEDDENALSIVTEKRVFSVRLGKLRTSGNGEGKEEERGETSECNVGARRCYSMGSFQYVVANSELRVEWRGQAPGGFGAGGGGGKMKVGGGGGGGQNGNFSNGGDRDGKRIGIRSKGESFSVSKIWMWSKKDKFLTSADSHHFPTSAHVNFP